MITQISIDGFRSLIDFKISVKPGLNILVGPNGTGKSNFVSFLDFLGFFLDDDLNSAVAVAQGAGSVFSKERTGPHEAKLWFRIEGSWEGIDDEVPDWRRQELSRQASYTYACEVRYNSDLPAVFVAFEELTIIPMAEEPRKITRRTNNESGSFRTSVDADVPEHVRKSMNRYARSGSKDQSFGEYLASRVAPEYSIYTIAAYMHDDIAAVLVELTKYRSVNIDPAVARKPTPVGLGYQLLPSGEGLGSVSA